VGNVQHLEILDIPREEILDIPREEILDIPRGVEFTYFFFATVAVVGI